MAQLSETHALVDRTADPFKESRSNLTCPNTTCFPSNQGVAPVQMKNLQIMTLFRWW